MKNRVEENIFSTNSTTPSKKKKSSFRSVRNLQSEFITSTSHQLRTPLATFQSSIELLEYYIKEKNLVRQQETIEKIKRTLRYLNSTIENITTLYKNTISKQKLSFKTINIRKFANDLLEEVVLSIGDEHFILINIETGITEIISDEFILKQILLNLIHNSIKFSPKGGQIKLEIFRVTNCIEFTLKDEGIGISKKDLRKIFTPFFRGNNASSFPGSGLGLAIVKKMAHILKAKIEYTSNVNVGTEFRVKIPGTVIK